MTDAKSTCPVCDSDLPESAATCPVCGTVTTEREPRRPHADRVPKHVDAASTIRSVLQGALGADFELGELVGGGGYAQVYRARDAKLKRDVAVKVLRPNLALTRVGRERFRREAEAYAQLRHAHIAPIYSVGESGDLSYLVMPMIVGESLRARLDRIGQFTIREACRIVLECASALQAAHDAGIVHRDIKPGNIMLEGEDGRVLVMDFGIAKAPEEHTSELTASGAVIGTPAYMSPEQAAGERYVDHRADLYALGVVGFEMLTGRLPFTGDSVRSLLLKHITEDPPPIRSFRTDCPESVAATLERCLAKEPQDRWASAARLDAALQAAVGSARRAPPSRLASTTSTKDDVVRLRRIVLVYLAGNTVFFSVDLLTNAAIDFAPIILAVSSLLIASAYSKLWMAGSDWRDLLGARTAGLIRPLDRSTTEQRQRVVAQKRSGMQAAVLEAAQRDRAMVVSLLHKIPRAKHSLVSRLLPATDALISRMADLIQRLRRLDGSIGRMRESVGEVTEIKAVNERDRARLDEARTRRATLADEIERCGLAIHNLRASLELAAAHGVSEARSTIEAALRDGNALARSGE